MNKSELTVLNSKTNLALAIVGHLSGKGVISSASICKSLDVSVSYIEQVVALLKKADIVTATRGPNGGYYLKNPNATVADVVRSVNPSAFECGRNQRLHSMLEKVMNKIGVGAIQ